jgi:hypothetical protein
MAWAPEQLGEAPEPDRQHDGKPDGGPQVSGRRPTQKANMLSVSCRSRYLAGIGRDRDEVMADASSPGARQPGPRAGGGHRLLVVKVFDTTMNSVRAGSRRTMYG